ncbi:MAG: hypothetical protein Q4F83_11125 [Eubacteriales bacterium]|nr:hypothetical protein [Eubacteriales bacterium]
MSNLPRVKVVNPGDDWLGTEYYINDQKIERVRAVDFRVAVDEVPIFVFETMGLPDIDMPGDIRFTFTPQTVTEAVKVLRNELLKHGDLYDGFLASIKLALNEAKSYTSEHNLAAAALDRIIGDEQ